MKRVLILLIIVAISCVGPNPKSKVKGVKFILAHESDDLSQFLRSNTLAYWQWVSQKLTTFTPYSQMGLIMGDAHVGNMYPTANFQCGTSDKLEWKNIDFDDAGVGPYFFDWVHYLVSLKVIDAKMNMAPLFEAYLSGLQGHTQVVPNSIAQYLSYNSDDFEKRRKKYVDQRTKNGRFDFGTDDMEVFESGPLRREQVDAKILDFFKSQSEVKIRDYAQIKKKRGGSSKLFRLNLLIEIDGTNKIFEFKQVMVSSLSQVAIQDAPLLRYQKLREYFGYCDKAMPIFEFENAAYLFKEKKTALYEVPYHLNETDDKSFLNDLALWGSYQLGVWHSGQSTSLSYREEVVSNTKLFFENAEYLTFQFVELLKDHYLSKP